MKKNVKGKSGQAAEASATDTSPADEAVKAAAKPGVSRKKAVTVAHKSVAGSAAAARPRRSGTGVQRTPAAPAETSAGEAPAPGLEPILTELHAVRQMLEKRLAPPLAADSALDASVDSLRRLLSELIEQRMESVVKHFVDVRREAANLGDGATRLVGRLDQLLGELGAVRFDAEPMDLVDPLIHTVVDERHLPDAPDGVILETLRPGYRTARGMVVCKAAVAVNVRP